MLPNDFARCPGDGSDADGWREGCEDCMRRTSPAPDPLRAWMIATPEVDPVHQWCPERIGPGMTYDGGRNG